MLPCFCRFLYDIFHILDHLHEIELFTVECKLSAFNLSHIKRFIDNSKQMCTGCIDFCQTLTNFLQIIPIQIGNSERCHTDNSIHWRADIVCHTGQKCGLRYICSLCCCTCIPHRLLLFEFYALFCINHLICIQYFCQCFVFIPFDLNKTASHPSGQCSHILTVQKTLGLHSLRKGIQIDKIKHFLKVLRCRRIFNGNTDSFPGRHNICN